MPSTLTPPTAAVLGLLAACRANQDEDDPRLVLADALQEWDRENPTYKTCSKCKGRGRDKDYHPVPRKALAANFAPTYLKKGKKCSRCDGRGTVRDDTYAHLAELTRVQCAIVHAPDTSNCTGISASWCPVCGDCSCRNPENSRSDDDCPLHSPTSPHAGGLNDRERTLTAALADWLTVECPECYKGRVPMEKYDGTNHLCTTCHGTGDLLLEQLDHASGNYKPRADFSRGLLTLKLPAEHCWEMRGHIIGEPMRYRPASVLAAILKSHVGPWVSEVRVTPPDMANLTVPEPIQRLIGHHDLADDANRAFVRAVPTWARAELGIGG